MTGVIIPFPSKPRRQGPEVVEVERCIDVATGGSCIVFQVVARDGRRNVVGVRDSLAEALDDVAWFRRGGVQVREIGNLGEGAQ